MSKKQIIDLKSITSTQIEEELKRIDYKSKYSKILRSTIYSLITIAAVAVLIATLIMPVLQVSGSSMMPLYKTGDIVVSLKTKNLKSGDVVAFYYGNKILIKRVIATPGNWVTIDDDGNVFVNGKKLEEDYVTKKTLGESDIKYPYQVPDGKWFVLSDVRENTIDSRNSEVGCVSNDNLIGKILFKVWPMK